MRLIEPPERRDPFMLFRDKAWWFLMDEFLEEPEESDDEES